MWKRKSLHMNLGGKRKSVSLSTLIINRKMLAQQFALIDV